MSESSKSPQTRQLSSRIKESGLQQNTIIQNQYFEMLDGIQRNKLLPQIQICLAKSICLGLDHMTIQEFTKFNYQMFIERIVNYNCNNPILLQLLQSAIDKTLRLKYEFDQEQEKIQIESQQPIFMENSRGSNFSFGYRQEVFRVCDLEEFNPTIIQSELQSPLFAPQVMPGSSNKIDDQETKNIIQSCFTSNSQINKFVQSQSSAQSKKMSSKKQMIQFRDQKQ